MISSLPLAKYQRRATALAALVAFLAAGGRAFQSNCPSHGDSSVAADGHQMQHDPASPEAGGVHEHRMAAGDTPANEHEHDGCNCVGKCCGSAPPGVATAEKPALRPAAEVPAIVNTAVLVAPRAPEASYLLPFANAPPLLA